MLLCTNYLVVKQKNSEKMQMKLTRSFTVNNSIIRLFCTIKPIIAIRKKEKQKPTAILYFKYLFIKCAQFLPLNS